MPASSMATLAAGFLFPPSIFWLIYFVGTVFASSWGPVGFMSVWSGRITEAAAFWGLIAGFLGNVIPKFMDYMGWLSLPSYLDPLLLGGALSLLVIALVSRRGRVSRKERLYRLRLHRTPPRERDARRYRWSLYAPALLLGYGVLAPLAYRRWYIEPYQAATGQLAAAGGIDWLAGEALVNLLNGVWLLPVALLLWRVLRRDYAGGARRRYSSRKLRR